MDSDYSGLLAILYVFEAIVFVFYTYCFWRIFSRANQPGWAAIVPVLSAYIQLIIIGRPWWWLLLFLVPIVNIVIGIIMMIELAYVFGRSSAFGIGLTFLPFIFVPILAFSDDPYRGPLVHAS